MCGIAGIIGTTGERRDRIDAMVRALEHRGPDDHGVERFPTAALGHRRLSIIDLEHGHQPMVGDGGNVAIVFNGEIYNFREHRRRLEQQGHRFRTTSDTEVLLALYRESGVRCVEALDGMFAFGIWDETRQRLVLARDHLGQKPLFYRVFPDGIAFASEIKAFLSAGIAEPRPDLAALSDYISLRFLPGDATLLAEVRKLPAAHILVWERGVLRVDRYWQLSFTEKWPGDEKTLTDALDQRLDATVREHTISDVQVGTFLSGGIDSSLMTALTAADAPDPVPTFSIGVVEQDFNELPFARLVAEQYRTDHHEEVVHADLVHLVPDMVWHLEEPADPFGVGVFLASRLAARHVKVVLSGDGGDELFAGYDRFAGSRYVDWLRIIPAPLRRTVVRRMIERFPDSFSYKSLAQKMRWANEMSLVRGGARYAEAVSFLRFPEPAKQQLFTPEARATIGGRDSRERILEHFESSHADSMIDRMLYTDLMTRIPDHLLAIVDRMAMAHGLEVRPPLLEHRMVKYAAAIPDRFKLKGTRLKHILREVASRHLPPSLIDRPKQGFGFPLAYWMRETLKPVLDDALATSRFVAAGVFDRDYVSALITEHATGRRDHNFRLWIFLNLEIWYRIFIEGEGRESVATWLAEHVGHPPLATAT